MDTYGDAKKFYSLSKLTFVGGSLIMHGGQNPLEPAREGNYILYGPYINNFKDLEKLFPKQYVMDSNHGSLVFRKATRYGLPHEVFKSYNHMLGVGKGWTWHEDLILKASNGQKLYFCHGKYKDVLKVAQQYGMCTIQGHYHTLFKIDYWSNPNELLWGMQVGCLVNMKSLAFEYNKLQKSRPVIGTGVIIDGLPKLIPMVLKDNGRWNRKIT